MIGVGLHCIQHSVPSGQERRYWYVKGKTKDQIREELKLEGSVTIYNMKNKAIGEFAVLYYGAGAIDFMY